MYVFVGKCFSDDCRLEMPNTIAEKIKRRIKRHGRRWVFCSGDFLDIGTRATVSKVLSQLVKEGMIRRVDRGIYDFPEHSELFGTLSPSTDGIVRLLIAPGEMLLPSGATAANLLGLSDQVPLKLVYYTNGRSRIRTVGGRTIGFKHARVPIMEQLSEKVNLVLQALYWIGKRNIDDRRVRCCRKILSDDDIQNIYAVKGQLPGWLADAIYRIECAELPAASSTSPESPE